jgi:hypothetical protein
MVHTAVVLPRDLLERMRADADQAQRGLSAEIRQRLQRSYELEGLPPGFVGFTAQLAIRLDRDLTEKWRQSRYGLQIFGAGLMQIIRELTVQGDEGVPNHGNAVVVGETHARIILDEQRSRESK